MAELAIGRMSEEEVPKVPEIVVTVKKAVGVMQEKAEIS